MRITKDIANDIAVKLLLNKGQEISDLKSNLSKKVFDLYNKSIPKEVLEFSKKHPEYFLFTDDVTIYGPGLNGQWVKSERVFKKNKNTSLMLNEKDAVFCKKCLDDISDKVSAYHSLKNEIETALYNLRTYAKVAESFPEAIQFLTKTATSTALIVNIDSIRQKLK